MKRSEINRAIRRAEALLDTHHWTLPIWGRWTSKDFRKDADTARYLRDHQMGWDVTDFGSGRFAECGLVLFCVRNGIVGGNDEITYAEKLLVVEENQVTPSHLHRAKMEDIINRAGGVLVIEFCPADDKGAAIEGNCSVRVDGMVRELGAWEKLRLEPGQSVTIPPGLYHRFYGEAGRGVVLVGEVSKVNDDRTDNYFLEPIGRFSTIEEDELPLRLLWSDSGK
jgi:hypothetical protein